MIDRYSLSEMTSIWSDNNRFLLFLEIEKNHLISLADLKKIPNHVPQIFEKFATTNI